MNKNIINTIFRLELKEALGIISELEKKKLDNFFKRYPKYSRSGFTKEDVITYAIEGIKKEEEQTFDTWLRLVKKKPALSDVAIDAFRLLTSK